MDDVKLAARKSTLLAKKLGRFVDSLAVSKKDTGKKKRASDKIKRSPGPLGSTIDSSKLKASSDQSPSSSSSVDEDDLQDLEHAKRQRQLDEDALFED